MTFNLDVPNIVIGAIVAGAVFFFTGFLREAGKDTYSWIKSRWWPQVKADPEKSAPQVHVHVASSDNAPPHSDITLQEITAAIDAVPPLQQKTVAVHYVGLRVQWDLNLVSADHVDGDRVKLFLQSGSELRRIVSCDVPLADYRQLGVLAAGSKLRVSGEIAEVQTLSVTLENVRLDFHPIKNEAQRRI